MARLMGVKVNDGLTRTPKLNIITPFEMGGTTYTIWRSRFGWIGLASTGQGLSAITSPRRTRREAHGELVTTLQQPATRGEDEHIRVAREELARYFRLGGQVRFRRVRLDTRVGTAFERRVWRQLREIPFGETCTYAELARAVGRPGAARAVGRCNAKNPWAIIVPCHRVVGSDGSLTGYAGGIRMKRRLLELEGVDVTALRATMLAAASGRKRGHADRD